MATPAEKRSDEIIKKENMSQVVKMRKAGMTFGQIAEELLLNGNYVYGLYKEAMDMLMIGLDEDVLEVRKLIVQRINDAINAIYEKVLDGDPHAIDRMIRLNDQLAQMTGAARPVALDVTSKGKEIMPVGPEMLQEMIKRAKKDVKDYDFAGDDEEDPADPSSIRRVFER